MSLSFIHVMSYVSISFFKVEYSFVKVEYSFVCVCHILIIHSFFDGHLGCFHVLSVVNNAFVNVSVQVSLWDPDFKSFQYIPKVEWLDDMVILFLIFWGATIPFSTVVKYYFTFTNSAQRFQYLVIIPNICFWFFFRY